MYILFIMTWEGMNQRKFPRVSYKCLIRVARDGREEEIDTFTENIGAGGICVVLDRDLGLFSEVSLEMYLGDYAKAVTCRGTVVWIVKRRPTDKTEMERYDTGIEFQNMKEEDKERLAQLVQSILGSDT